MIFIFVGLLHPQYLVEIVVHAWDSADPRNDNLAVGKMRAHPIHLNEDNRAYCRCDGTVREVYSIKVNSIIFF